MFLTMRNCQLDAQTIANQLNNGETNRRSTRRHNSLYSCADDFTFRKNMHRKVYITRKMGFCAAHRLHSKHLTDEENADVFGIHKCNWVHGHGHNYKVNVTVFGKIDPKTGLLMNVAELKKSIEKVIVRMDHRNLDADVDFFKDNPSSAENISVYIWLELKKVMERPELLHEVEVYETDNVIATYRGD